MSLVSYFCPTCSMQLWLPEPAPGASIRCKSCRTVWEPQSSPVVHNSNPSPSAPPRTNRNPDPPSQRGPVPLKDPVKNSSLRNSPSGVEFSPTLAWGFAGGAIALVALFLICGGVALIFSLRPGKQSTSAEVAHKEDKPHDSGTSTRKADRNPNDGQAAGVRPGENRPIDHHLAGAEANMQPGDGSLPREVLDRVKAATVYIRVTSTKGEISSGSGFFEESSHKVLTNAHVVGMLKPGAPQPRLVEVVRNSGGAGEVVYQARILAVDQTSDLAVLSVVLTPEEDAYLPTLRVTPARDLIETQRVYVLGYPFGEKFNRNVTVNISSVSSLHTFPNGRLKRIQINGGMNPGNSGGPVVDVHGNVVGIAVSGLENTQINFAIPGEHVAPILAAL
jgi:S1-C subfamily serine protease